MTPQDTILQALLPVPEASDFVELAKGVQFSLPVGKTRGMNRARIVQDHHGTFTIEFFRLKRHREKGFESKPYGEFRQVQLSDLKSIFHEATGLPWQEQP